MKKDYMALIKYIDQKINKGKEKKLFNYHYDPVHKKIFFDLEDGAGIRVITEKDIKTLGKLQDEEIEINDKVETLNEELKIWKTCKNELKQKVFKILKHSIVLNNYNV